MRELSGHQKGVDIVVGMVTPEAQPSPVNLIHRIALGLDEYFPQYSWTLVNATAGRPPHQPALPDGVAKNLISIQTPRFGVHRVTYPWHGVPAKTNGLRAILEIAQRMSAKVCLLADPSHHGFESNWVYSLSRPGIHSNYDLVTPDYSGCARDRLISAHLLAPLLRALFGQGPKQPMPGDLLLSARLINRLLARHDWDSAPARYTPELWVTSIAAAEGYRIAESAVGPPRRQFEGPRLSGQAAIGQIFGSFLALMEQYENKWVSEVSVIEVDRFGPPNPIVRESANPDGLRYAACFVDAFPAMRNLWQSILQPRTFIEIAAFYAALQNGENTPALGDAVWVRIVYEMSAAWKHRVFPRSQVLGLFTPLLMARLGSFLMSTQWKEQSEVEAELSRSTKYFEALRPVLKRLWSGYAPVAATKQAKALHGAEAA